MHGKHGKIYLSPTNNTDFLDFYHADKTIRSFALQKSLYRLHGCHAAFYVFIICAKLLFFKITTKHFSNFCNKSKPSPTQKHAKDGL